MPMNKIIVYTSRFVKVLKIDRIRKNFKEYFNKKIMAIYSLHKKQVVQFKLMLSVLSLENSDLKLYHNYILM